MPRRMRPRVADVLDLMHVYVYVWQMCSLDFFPPSERGCHGVRVTHDPSGRPLPSPPLSGCIGPVHGHGAVLNKAGRLTIATWMTWCAPPDAKAGVCTWTSRWRPPCNGLVDVRASLDDEPADRFGYGPTARGSLDPLGAAPDGKLAWRRELDRVFKPPARCNFGEACRYRATCTFYHGDGLEQPGILGVCACEDAACPRGHPLRSRRSVEVLRRPMFPGSRSVYPLGAFGL